jgi:hypothetical protein
MQMSENSPSPKPSEIGCCTLRRLAIALLVVCILIIAIAVLDVVLDVSAPEYAINSLFVGVALVSVALLIAPGIAFLIHSLAHRDQGVSARLRSSALWSAFAPASIGVLMITSGNTSFVAVGWLLVGDTSRYTADLVALKFKSSTDVNAPTIVVVPGSWRATTSHNRLKNVVCGISVNTTNPIAATAGEGEPVCAP